MMAQNLLIVEKAELTAPVSILNAVLGWYAENAWLQRSRDRTIPAFLGVLVGLRKAIPDHKRNLLSVLFHAALAGFT